MRRLIEFVTNMDARAWRTVAVSFVLFGGVGIVFLFGAQLLGLNGKRRSSTGWAPRIEWGWPLVAALAFIAVGPAVVAYRCWGAPSGPGPAFPTAGSEPWCRR